jgi:iron complex outermembrane receptor protein
MKLKVFTTITTLLVATFCLKAQDSIAVTLKIVQNTEYNIEIPMSEVDVTVKVQKGQDVYPNITSDNEGKVTFKLPKDNKTYRAIFKKVGYSTESIDFTSSSDATITQTMQSSESIADIEPIDVYNQEQLIAFGRANLGDVLHYLVPSIYHVPQTIADLTDHVTPTTMKGFSTDQTLLLINGKRVHSSALVHVNGSVGRGNTGFDINTIPLAAIDRVEIYRAGASVRFGSDAIAGVINIILKGEKSKEGSASFGLLGSTTTSERNDDFPGEGRTARLSGHVGLPIVQNDTRKGYINLTGEYNYYGPINRSGDTRDNLGLSNDFYKALEDEQGLKNGRIMRVGRAETADYQLFLNSRLLLSSNAEFYATGFVSNRVGESYGFYRLRDSIKQIGLSIYEENGFLPGISSDINDRSITTGLVLNKNDWKSEISHTLSSNKIDIGVFNSNNASLGEASPTQFNAGAIAYNQSITNIDFEGKLSGVLTLNFGTALRVEQYQLFAGEEASYIQGLDSTKVSGAQVFPGYRPENEVNEIRPNTGTYALLNFKKQGWVATGGLRFETYEGITATFEKNVIFKGALKWSPSEQWNIRGSYNEGFRAPSLHQVYFSSISTQIPDQVLTFNSESRFKELLGVPDLSPESSRNFNLGGNFKFKKNLSFSLDGYWIGIKERIIFSSQVLVSSLDSLDSVDSNVINLFKNLDVDKTQFFINAAETATWGIDANFNISEILVGKNKLAILLGGTWNKNTLVDDSINVQDQLQGLEDEIFNKEERSRLEEIQPQWKAFLNAQLDMQSGLYLRAKGTLFGAIKYISGNFEQEFAPIALVDLEFGGKFLKESLNASIGCNNIFLTYPNEQLAESPDFRDGRFPYSRRTRQFLESGGIIYARLTFNL